MRVTPRSAPAALVLLGALQASPAWADFPPRLDHAGALGFALELGSEYGATVALTSFAQKSIPRNQLDAVRGVAAVSGSWGLASGDELVLTTGGTLGPMVFPPGHAPYREWGFSLAPSYRDFRSRAEWKSFIEAGLKLDTTPRFAIGPMVAVGVEYEVTPVMGVYLRGAGSLGLSQILRAGLEATLGIQGRTYLF